ncbi:MAG: lysophospholipid acyltransferase family protein [Gammaproteobacteria bacterium]|nr:1-acyl-sn-glycerol-3-phosphate acyltransferase [Pseudomonadales bacterium]MCP5347763.1 1-acyl-sn-glycerol-3-phosphate acyltransferase [Pseudomonadales bacterium]
MKKLTLFLRSLLFYVGYVVVTLTLAVISLAVVWFLPESKQHLFHKLWCWLMLGWLRICCGIRYEVTGLENVPSEPVVVLANHQSEWETMFLYRHLAPICPILKKELLEIPVYGWAMRLVKPIAIDRSKRHEASRSILVQGRDRLESGRSVFIFPEGTRALPGQVKSFSRSGAKLAISAAVPILPIAHDSGQCWPAHKFLKQPGTVHVQIGLPLASGQDDASALTARVEQWVRQQVVGERAES